MDALLAASRAPGGLGAPVARRVPPLALRPSPGRDTGRCCCVRPRGRHGDFRPSAARATRVEAGCASSRCRPGRTRSGRGGSSTSRGRGARSADYVLRLRSTARRRGPFVRLPRGGRCSSVARSTARRHPSSAEVGAHHGRRRAVLNGSTLASSRGAVTVPASHRAACDQVLRTCGSVRVRPRSVERPRRPLHRTTSMRLAVVARVRSESTTRPRPGATRCLPPSTPRHWRGTGSEVCVPGATRSITGISSVSASSPTPLPCWTSAKHRQCAGVRRSTLRG